jgi:uncharacterized protein YciI
VGVFVVELANGPGYDPGRDRREQEQWDAHAAFMDALVDDGFVVLGGPLGDGGTVLLVVEALDEAEIRSRLSEDPWEPLRILETERITPWTIWLDGRGQRGEGASPTRTSPLS